jgi:RHS repeat-associated protein
LEKLSGGVNFSYASNNVNEYTDITPGTYTPAYDYAGNLTQDKSGYKYVYDYENRLTQITRQDNTVVATFEYDALGRRIEKVDTIAGTTKRFYYDDQRIVLQTESDGQTQTDRTFVYGNYIDEVLVMSVIPAQGAIQDYYYGHDHLYSPVALFESDGDVVERYEYDVYGQMRRLNPDFSAFSGTQVGNPYYFTGRERDSLDAGSCTLYYYRARLYDPQAGRFLQRDSAQYVDSMNLYEYVMSNSVNFLDPFGLWHYAFEPQLRSYGKNALVVPDCGETLDKEAIAELTGLDAMEFDKWAKPVGNSYLVPNTAYVDRGNVADQIIPGIDYKTKTFNLVNLSIIIELNDIAKYFTDQGYDVIRKNDVNLANLNSHFADQNIIAFAFGGHGAGKGELVSVNGDTYAAIDAVKVLNHKLARVILYSCEAAFQSEWDKNHGIPKWADIVSPNGSFLAPMGTFRAFNTDWEELLYR